MADETAEQNGNASILDETAEYVDVTVGVSAWQETASERHILEEDYPVSGEVWRVRKSDADPFPSSPHAHCLHGRRRFIGCKLHLGTAELYDGRKPLGRRLHKKQFEQLIDLIRPKFPGITLPLV